MPALSDQTYDRGSYDVVVYRATAAGAVAAIAAAQSGARVVIVESGRNVGGMVSGGLGRTDMDQQQQLIGGFAGEFYRQVGRHYDKPLAWFFEPHVAERVFRDWLEEAGVPVHFEQRLVSVEPYEIPYRSLLPRYHECSNLLVPVAISASHVAFASFRMEPQFMIAGHAAGVAAALSLRLNVPVHHVPIAELQTLLRAQGQIVRQ